MNHTVPYLTKYEMSRIIGIRAAQLAHGAPSDVTSIPHDRVEQALTELRNRKLHAYIRRPISAFGHETERVHLNELSFDTVPGIRPEFVDPRFEIPMTEIISYTSETMHDTKCSLRIHCVLPPWKLLNAVSLLTQIKSNNMGRVVVLKSDETTREFGVVNDILSFETKPSEVMAMDNGCTRVTCEVVAAVQLYRIGERHTVVCVKCTPHEGGFEVEGAQRDGTSVKFCALSSCHVAVASDVTVRIKTIHKNAKGVLVCSCENID